MKTPLIKVCGITNLEDAQICLQCGAHMLGFIFYEKSPRYVQPITVKEILTALKNDYNFNSVGVFVNSDIDYINKVSEITGINILQFHGEEPPSFINTFDQKKIKAFRIKDSSDVLNYHDYMDAEFFLFDTFSKDIYGGTGKVFDWNLLSDFQYKDRLILSGGINCDNIIDAVESVSPYAIDVSSSLEVVPGKKDNKKVEFFFSRVNSIN